MTTTKFTIQKSEAVVDDDGMFTTQGMALLTQYANEWVRGSRNLDLERANPDLVGSFYDIRSDPDYARRWADDAAFQKSLDEELARVGLAPTKLVIKG